MKNKKALLYNLILPLTAIVCLLAVWGVSAFALGKEYILPTISSTFTSLFAYMGTAQFYRALGGTLLRTLIAFAISFGLAFTFAYFSKRSKVFKSIISPFISIMRALPTVAIILILVIWTNSYVAPVIVTMLVVLPTVYASVYDSICVVSDEQIETCRLFGVSEREILTRGQIPQILPPMLRSVGAGLSLNLKLMVAAEVLSATSRSIGSMLNSASYNSEIAQMMALVVITVAIGLIIDAVFGLISKKVGKWQ